MKSKSKKTIGPVVGLLFGIFTFLTTLNSPSHANTEEAVANIYESGTPYLLVYSDQIGESQRAPGIYARGTDGWELAVAGQPFSVPLRSGLMGQLKLTETTHRFESIHVVDGILTVLSTYSRNDEPTTFLKLGHGELTVEDPTDSGTVAVPPITQMQDVRLHVVPMRATRTRGTKLELVLATIKAPNQKGSGMTVAFVISSDTTTQNVIKVVYKPILLDWEFHTSDDLTGLYQQNPASSDLPSQVISHNLLRSFSRPPRHIDPTTEHPVLRNWRRLMSRPLDQLTPTERFQLPVYNAETGLVEISSLPMAEISGIAAFQAVLDPVSHRHGIAFTGGSTVHSLGSWRNQPLVATGALSCNEQGCGRLDRKEGGNLYFYFARMHEGAPKLLLRMGAKVEALDIPIAAEDTAIPEFSNYSWEIVRANDESVLVLFSFQTGSAEEGSDFIPGETILFEIRRSGLNNSLSARAVIANQFFDEAQLSSRLIRGAPNGHMYFDVINEWQGSQAAYAQSRRLTAPHIDLEDTLRTKEVKYHHPQALEHIVLSPVVSFDAYERPKGFQPATGLYATFPQPNAARDGTPTNVFQRLRLGTLVRPSFLAADIIDRQRLTVRWNSASTSNLDLFVVGMDASAQKNGDSTDLVLISHSDNGDLTPSAITLGVTFPIANLNYMKLIPYPTWEQATEKNPDAQAEGQDRQSQPGIPATAQTLARRVDPSAAASFPYVAVTGIEGQGTILTTFAIRKSPTGGPLLGIISRQVISPTVLPQAEVEDRLRFDDRGEAYFVLTPELASSDNSFSLASLHHTKRIEPNLLTVRLRFRGIDRNNRATSEERRDSTWRAYRTDPIYRGLVTAARTSPEFAQDFFDDVKDLLEELSDPSKPARKVALLVPSELRTHIENYIFALRARDRDRPKHWAEQNDRLLLYLANPNIRDQETIIKELTFMRDASAAGTNRALLYGTMRAIKEIGAPKLASVSGETVGFQVSERVLGPASGGDNSGIQDRDDKKAPSLSYLIATEGKPISLQDFQRDPPASTFSSVLIGTAEEWSEYTKSYPLEGRFEIEKAFQVVKVDAPSIAARKNYVLALLNRPEVRDLRYRIDVAGLVDGWESLNEPERMNALAESLVRKAEKFSQTGTNRTSVFSGLLRVLNALGYELTNNSEVRRRRVIDVTLINQLLGKVFGIPPNISTLPDGHYLRILDSHSPGQKPGDRAALRWLIQGYYGPKSFRMEFIKTVLKQLEQNESLKVPSSMIIYGESGTGKTQLVLSFFKLVNLKLYDFQTGADNSKAAAFHLNLSKVFDADEPSAPKPNASTGGMVRSSDQLSLNEALSHLDKFLAGPMGHMGFVFFDDVHLAPDHVKQRILQKVRGWLDDGKYHVGTADRMAEYPTRNLNVILALNPTASGEVLKNVMGSRSGSTPTLEDKVLAGLSSKNYMIESSFLRRFGLTLEIPELPEEAKGPMLIDLMRASTQQFLETDAKVLFITPDAIGDLVAHFPRLDARTFSTATTALAQGVRSSPGRVFIRVPNRHAIIEQHDQLVMPMGGVRPASGLSFGEESLFPSPIKGERIEEYVNRAQQLIPLDGQGSYRGRLELVRYLADNFRKSMLRSLLTTFLEVPQQEGSSLISQYVNAPFAYAFLRHMITLPSLMLHGMNLEPHDFGAQTRDQIRNFGRLKNNWTRLELSSFPQYENFGLVQPSSTAMNFLSHFRGSDRTRAMVIRTTVDRLKVILQKGLALAFHLENVHEIPDSRAFLAHLKMRDEAPTKAVGKEILTAFETFRTEISDPSLKENQESVEGNHQPPSGYDQMRIFLLAVDRALAELPWSTIGNFASDLAISATRNTQFSQSSAAQSFLFTDAYSPFVSSDAAIMRAIASNVPFFDAELEASNHDGFMRRCNELLVP